MAEVPVRELGGDYPEIADDFRKGYTLSKSAQAYSPDFDISQRVAESSIWEALTRLIDPKEFTILCASRRKEAAKYRGSLGGTQSFRRRVGAFGMSKTKRKAASVKGGRTGRRAHRGKKASRAGYWNV